MYTYNLYYAHTSIYIYILAFFLSSLSHTHLIPALSRSLSLSRSVFLFLSSLPLSLIVSRFVFSPWYLYLSRTRMRFPSCCHSFSVRIFLSLSLSFVIFLFLLYTFMYITKPGSLYATSLVWLLCRQLFGKHLSHPLFALLDICCCQQLTQCEALVHPCDSLVRCCRESTRTLPFTGAVKVNSPFSSRRDIKIDVCK